MKYETGQLWGFSSSAEDCNPFLVLGSEKGRVSLLWLDEGEVSEEDQAENFEPGSEEFFLSAEEWREP